jgi:hypothetical protein
MYSHENSDHFPLATCNPASPEKPSAWMTGHIDYNPANRSNWDVEEDIKKSPLFAYAPSVGILKCPADRSVLNVPGRGNISRVRSMTMNQHVGGFEAGAPLKWLTPWRFFKRSSELIDPGPTGTWVFLDMREDSVNYPSFEVVMDGWPNQPNLLGFRGDLPGFYHHRAAGLSYADGHSEIRRWRDQRTMPPLTPPFTGLWNPKLWFLTPNNPDVRWLEERTTRPVR